MPEGVWFNQLGSLSKFQTCTEKHVQKVLFLDMLNSFINLDAYPVL